MQSRGGVGCPSRRGGPAWCRPRWNFLTRAIPLGSAGILFEEWQGDHVLHRRCLFSRPDPVEKRAVPGGEGGRVGHGDHAGRIGVCRRGLAGRVRWSAWWRRSTRRKARKGCVLIPSFALGRTQEMLALLALLMKAGKLRKQPIYIGGLGRVFTEIYDIEAHRAHRSHEELRLNEALQLVVLEKGQADSKKLSGGKICVITAGMMSENTAAHDLAKRMAGDERQSIFFVGYADPDSPAGRLKAAAQGETFVFSPSGGRVTRNCDLQEFDLTAHANREELLDFVGEVGPKTVLLGHGDAASRQWFEARIAERWPKIRVVQPRPGVAERVDG